MKPHPKRIPALLGLVVMAAIGATIVGSAPAQADSSITLEMSTGPADADTAPGPTILAGENVNWFYQVTNTSDVTLTDLVVTDDNPTVVVRCPARELVPGASTVCQATAPGVVGQYANVGTATASSVDGSIVVSAQDPSHYLGVAPSIQLDSMFPSDEVVAGDSGQLELIVTNNGDVDLGDVVIRSMVDPRLVVTDVSGTDGSSVPDDDPQTVVWRLASLDAGQSETVRIGFTVAADASPTPSVGNTATAEHLFTDDVDNSVLVTSTASDAIAIALSDTDGDGVADTDDLCANSDLDPAPSRLKPNRNWTDSSDLSSTFGCSASQIIAEAGLGSGHGRFGISNSALAAWLAGND